MNDDTLELALKNISLESDDQDNDLQLIALLSQRIAELLDGNPDLLFSTLYRLDIYESKINKVLREMKSDAPTGLAQLIVERQREKLRTRNKYGAGPDIEWDDDPE